MSMDSEEFLRKYTLKAMTEGRVSALAWAFNRTIGVDRLRAVTALALYYAAMWVLVDGMYYSRLGATPQPLATPLEEHLVAGTFVVSLIAARKVVNGIDHPWLNK